MIISPLAFKFKCVSPCKLTVPGELIVIVPKFGVDVTKLIAPLVLMFALSEFTVNVSVEFTVMPNELLSAIIIPPPDELFVMSNAPAPLLVNFNDCALLTIDKSEPPASF